MTDPRLERKTRQYFGERITPPPFVENSSHIPTFQNSRNMEVPTEVIMSMNFEPPKGPNDLNGSKSGSTAEPI
jgi:hypothetical protein